MTYKKLRLLHPKVDTSNSYLVSTQHPQAHLNKILKQHSTNRESRPVDNDDLQKLQKHISNYQSKTSLEHYL